MAGKNSRGKAGNLGIGKPEGMAPNVGRSARKSKEHCVFGLAAPSAVSGCSKQYTECMYARVLDLVYTDVSVPATKPSSDPGTKRVIAAGVNRLHSSETPPTTSACVLMLATHPAACCMAACKITVDLGRMVQPALPCVCNTTCWLLAFAPALMAQAHDQGGSATEC